MIKRSSGAFNPNQTSEKKDKKLSKAEAYQKACHYCAYQERTQQEARDKLYDLGLSSDEVEELLTKLLVENYINEERFARSFAGGKFRMKKWGRIKIIQELKLRNLSQYCINKGMSEIDNDNYLRTLEELAEEKAATVTESNEYKRKNKIGNFLMSKGFEPDLVWETIKRIL